MVANKKRLYLAIYPSGRENEKYAFALLVGPKEEGNEKAPGTRYFIQHHHTEGWRYKTIPDDDIRVGVTLLARIVIAKVTDEVNLIDIFKITAINYSEQHTSSRSWVINVLLYLAEMNSKVVGTAKLSWPAVQAKALEYVQQKHAEGRYGSGQDMTLPKPTFDLLQNKELIA
ncbi:uncharacterized protein GGS25DRAFT_217825 [Hypoxylon fragiforme]|uniref:uncharacterized protein n=1 Tax=Hypoxylon fragiforme TaxID=63214 RepID=UPI0020C70B01|nr:uncharacterized protein GGS25DRAFT_217825 [Hypoxylon fragiforme]KAI2609476.1 hypothetical protein GGS25DRAFT_217825 [Hypoxylon fragiforme]